MSEDHLHERISDRGYFEKFLAERDRRLDERFAELDKALRLQAEEYARRLHELNGAFERDRERQGHYVTVDKYEDKMKAEAQARTLALERIDEKFEDYVKRYEARQREVDLLLTAQKAAAEAAQKAAEDEGRRIREQAAEQGRKQSRNLVVVGLALSAFVALANFVAPHLG